MTDTPLSRRRFVAATATALPVLSGCSYVTGRFILSGFAFDTPARETYLTTRTPTTEANFKVDFTPERKEKLYRELVETGTLSCVEWPFTYSYEFGRSTRTRPRYVRHEGVYYDVECEMGSESRELVELFMRPIDGDPPENVRTRTTPVDSLSKRDRTILSAALKESRFEAEEAKSEPQFGGRGVLYHPGIDISESDLAPDPAFDYVRWEGRWWELFTERGTMELDTYSFSLREVAREESAYVNYLHEHDVFARIGADEISGQAERIPDAATTQDSGFIYEERPPASGGLRTVLERLGIDDRVKPYREYDDYEDFDFMPIQYKGGWYEVSLKIIK